MANMENNSEGTGPTNSPPQNEKSESKPSQNRASKLAAVALSGVVALASFIAGGKLEERRTSQTPPVHVSVSVQSPQKIRESSEAVKNILKKVADKTTRVEDAVAQICGELGLSSIDVVDQLRRLVTGALYISADKDFQDLVDAIFKLATATSRPSPIPTATIVVPSKR